MFFNVLIQFAPFSFYLFFIFPNLHVKVFPAQYIKTPICGKVKKLFKKNPQTRMKKSAKLLLAALLLLGDGTGLRGRGFHGRFRVCSALQLRYFLSYVQHDGLPGLEFVLAELSLLVLQVNTEPSNHRRLFAPLPGVELPLQNVVHLGVVQHHFDLLIGWSVYSFSGRDPSTLLEGLLAVEEGGVDADPSLGVVVGLHLVERTYLWRTPVLIVRMGWSYPRNGRHSLLPVYISCRSESRDINRQ